MIEGQISNTVYFSGKCNLKCVYCFHPKFPEQMKRINKEIRGWIKSGKMLEDMKYVHGEELKVFALWGGEPTFNLDLLTDQLPEFFKAFPKLEAIDFSTNISTKLIVGNIKLFIKGVHDINVESKRKVKIKIQLSLDGPSDLNNCNRVGSKSDKTVEQMTELIRFLVEGKYSNEEVELRGKSTQTMDSIRKLTDVKELISYFDFYDKVYGEWSKITRLYPRIHAITYVYPGRYTKEDGEDLLKFLKVLYESDELYEYPFKYIKDFKEQLFHKWVGMYNTVDRKKYRVYGGEFEHGTACSVGGGDFGMGYDGNFHICQGTFFFDDQVMKEIESKDMVHEFEKTQGYSFRNFDNYIKDKWIFPYRNLLRTYRALFLLENYNKGLHFRHHANEIMIRQLAMSGLVDKKYMRDGLDLDMFSMIMTMGGFSCVANNVWETGTVWTQSLSVIKLIGNGVLDYMMDIVRKEVCRV